MREFQLLEHVFAANDALPERVLIRPGDDMAMIRIGGVELLAAVDQLVGGRHFRPEVTPVDLIGRKAVTRSLSDVAAMAAEPVASLASATLPPDFGETNATALFDAMRETAQQYQCPLVGGDIAFHESPDHPLVCAVTVLAKPGVTARVITRDAARIDDRVYVTGLLGGSIDDRGLGRHLTFEPRIREALELLDVLGDRLHAMIDISDGLGRDAAHLAEQSQVQIEIDAARIPCNEGIGWRDAAAMGEDYELLFTATGKVPDSVGSVPVMHIGRVIGPWNGPDRERDNDPFTWRVIIREGDELHNGASLGWEHDVTPTGSKAK